MPLDATQPDALTLIRGGAEGALGLLTGLLNARGLSWGERIANIAWMRKLKRTGFVRPPYETVAQMLAPLPRRVAQGLREPLCLAALNTPTAAAPVQPANVLKAAFAGRADASDFLLPATDLTALFPEAAARFVVDRGGAIRTSAPARVVRSTRSGTTVLTGTSLHEASAAIVAVGPHQISGAFAPEAVAALPALRTLQASLATLAYEPIFTVWLGYGEALPLPMVIARLDDAPGQWVVDRADVLAQAQGHPGRPELRQLLAVILSAHGPHEALDHGILARDIDAQLRRLPPDRPPCLWFQVIAEKRATYACTPGRARPAGYPAGRRRLSRRRLHEWGLSCDAGGRRAQRRRCRGGGAVRFPRRGKGMNLRIGAPVPTHGRRPNYARPLPGRLRSSRCCSRAHSRSLIVSRLSCCFLPFASPTSILTRPFL